MSAWYEEVGFWTDLHDFLFSHVLTREAAASEAEQIIALLELEGRAPVLDLCCGPGRHSLELARRGLAVTAVDLTSSYLEKLEAQAAKEKLAIEAVNADMRQFRRPAAFDGAINLYSSFGYFEDPEDDLRVLRNLHEALRPGGKLLMDMQGKEPLARKFRERDWHTLPDGSGYVLEERKLRGGWGWLDVRWILVRDGAPKTFNFGLRLYSGAELKASLRQAGFSDVVLYGDLDESPYDLDAKRLVAVATR